MAFRSQTNVLSQISQYICSRIKITSFFLKFCFNSLADVAKGYELNLTIYVVFLSRNLQYVIFNASAKEETLLLTHSPLHHSLTHSLTHSLINSLTHSSLSLATNNDKGCPLLPWLHSRGLRTHWGTRFLTQHTSLIELTHDTFPACLLYMIPSQHVLLIELNTVILSVCVCVCVCVCV